MPRRAQPSSRSRVWRTVGLAAAAILGIAAVCLLVFANTAKQAQLAVLLGAWAIFIAAPTIFGTRRAQLQAMRQRLVDERSAELSAAHDQIVELQDSHLTAVREAQQNQEVELRRFGELQLARETAARREADFRLEIALRSEIEKVLSEQVGSLREEVAALRSDVVDNLGGRLRLERVETTRFVASDIEALQNEIRMLQGSKESLAASSGAVGEADLVEPVWSVVDAAESTAAAQSVGGPAQSETTSQPRARAASSDRDPFAGLPRLSPIPSELVGLIDPVVPSDPVAEVHESGRGAQQHDPGYVGRRRAAAGEPSKTTVGGRRRAPDDSDDELDTRLRTR
jgi:hypothetical protein